MTQFNLFDSPTPPSNSDFLTELEIKGGFAGVMQPTSISELPSESDNEYIDEDDYEEAVFEKWGKVWGMAVDFHELEMVNRRSNKPSLPIVIQDLIYDDILENPLIGNYLTGKMSIKSMLYWTIERIEEFVTETYDAILIYHQSYFPEKYN